MESARSLAPLAICWPAKVSSAPTEAIPAIITRMVATPRGRPIPSRNRTTGLTSAVISRATATGIVMTAKYATSHSSR